MKFIVEPNVFKVLKGACFAVVVASGVDNSREIPEIKELLQQYDHPSGRCIRKLVIQISPLGKQRMRK